jgi:glucosylceramidase
MGNVSIGDGRTREELDALGFPAKYLDKGVAVQPIYYYMGHVSRFVRPGSRSVSGIVTQGNTSVTNRIFRPGGSVVAGGGENDLARVGIEVTLWPCEGSTRQQFSWTNEKAAGNPIIVHGHDWLGHPTTSCLSNIEDEDVLGIRLESCEVKKNKGIFVIVPVHEDPLGRSRIYLKNPQTHRSGRDQCLVVRKLSNNGGAYGPRGGAQVTIGGCTNSTSFWKVDSATGEISSYEFASLNNSTGLPNESETVCMTTGWPFLQMGAFTLPNGNKTLVLLNEAKSPANYALVDRAELILTGNIPPRSVQSFQLKEESD